MKFNRLTTSNGRVIDVTHRKQRMILTLYRGSKTIPQVSVTWCEKSVADAVERVDSLTMEEIGQKECFHFCADFVTKLTDALENAHTKKTTKPDYRAYGKHATRRY